MFVVYLNYGPGIDFASHPKASSKLAFKPYQIDDFTSRPAQEQFFVPGGLEMQLEPDSEHTQSLPPCQIEVRGLGLEPEASFGGWGCDGPR